MMRYLTIRSFYYPGLISIILLPLFCSCYVISSNVFFKKYALNVSIWNGKETKKNNTIGIQKFINSKTYETIHFTGGIDDKKKLIEARKKVKQLILTEDTLHGIKFHFGKRSTYNTFVETINVLVEEQAKVYVPYKNDIFFAILKKKNKSIDNKKINFFRCGSCFIIKQEQFTQIDWEKHFNTLKRFSFPLLFFILMLYFGLKRR